MNLTSPPRGGTSPADDDLVGLLTTTLAAQAQTVQNGAVWSGAPAATARSTIRLRPGRGRRWVPPLAAAAAVAAVVGIVIAVERMPHHSHPAAPITGSHTSGAPTSPAPTSPSPSSPTSPAPTTGPTVAAQLTCPAALPSAWSAAYRNGLVNVGGAYATPMSVSANGTLVIYRDGGVTPGSPRQILLVPPGQAPQVVYQLSNPDEFDVQTADLVGDNLVVGLGSHPRYPRNTVPGSTAGPNITSLFVLNLATHHQQPIASASYRPLRAPSITEATVYGDTVYWDSEHNERAGTATIQSYDLSSGARHTVYAGPVGYLAMSAAGIGWFEKHGGYQVHVSVPLPSAVAAAVPAGERLTVGTDGTAYAWMQSPSVVGWWTPGVAKPIYRQLPDRLQLPGSFPAPVVVSGSFVFAGFGDLLDMRTGGRAPIGTTRLGGYARPDPAYLGRGSTLVGIAQQPGNGEFVSGYWADPQTVVLRIVTGHLPGLHC